MSQAYSNCIAVLYKFSEFIITEIQDASFLKIRSDDLTLFGESGNDQRRLIGGIGEGTRVKDSEAVDPPKEEFAARICGEGAGGELDVW